MLAKEEKSYVIRANYQHGKFSFYNKGYSNTKKNSSSFKFSY